MQPHRLIPGSVRASSRHRRSRGQRPCRRTVSAVRERGQALVLFVLMSLVMIGSVAIVTDISWLWYGNQRMQRAADAAALAGAIYLPGNPTPGLLHGARRGDQERLHVRRRRHHRDAPPGRHQQAAPPGHRVRAASTRSSPRRWASAASAPRRHSKAEYVLPVPMGSPEDYYGVGDFLATVTNTNVANSSGNTDWHIQTARPSTVWTTPQNADQTSQQRLRRGAVHRATPPSSGARSASRPPPAPPSRVPRARCRHPAPGRRRPSTASSSRSRHSLTGSGSTNGCQLQAELSWNAGTNWTTPVNFTPAPDHEHPDPDARHQRQHLGLGPPRLDPRRPQQPPGAPDVLKADRLGPASRRASSTWTPSACAPRGPWSPRRSPTPTRPGPSRRPTGVTLPSKGFWGAIITSGGNRSNGDQFSPKLSGGVGQPRLRHQRLRLHHRHQGRRRPGPDLRRALLRGRQQRHRRLPAAPATTGSAGSANGVTTIYSLYNENGTPYVTTDDTLVASSGNLFANKIQADYTQGATPGNTCPTRVSPTAPPTPITTPGTASRRGLAAGTYRLNVSTVDTPQRLHQRREHVVHLGRLGQPAPRSTARAGWWPTPT